MRGIKVILAVGAVVTTTMVVTAPAMAQTVLAALVTLASVDSSFDGGGLSAAMVYPLANDEPSITRGSADIQFVSGCCFNTADLDDFGGIIFA